MQEAAVCGPVQTGSSSPDAPLTGVCLPRSVSLAARIWISPPDVLEGLSANLTCAADRGAAGHPRYTWYKDSRRLAEGPSKTLALPNVTVADAGYYHCAVQTAERSRNSSLGTLNVLCKPCGWPAGGGSSRGQPGEKGKLTGRPAPFCPFSGRPAQKRPAEVLPGSAEWDGGPPGLHGRQQPPGRALPPPRRQSAGRERLPWQQWGPKPQAERGLLPKRLEARDQRRPRRG